MKSSSKVITALVVMIMCLCTVSFAFCSEEASATYDRTTDIAVAPGYQYTYSPTFPSDLSVTTTIDFQKVGSDTGTDVSIASFSNGTLSVTIPSNASTGTKYLVQLKSTTTTGGISQTFFERIIFTVNAALTISTTTLGSIVLGSAVNVTATATGLGTITWSKVSGDSTLFISSTGKITGTPTSIGSKTIVVKAMTSYGETVQKTLTVNVYSKIANGSASQTITTTYGTTISSSAITNGSDIGVSWTLKSGTMPPGWSLNASTGVVSGKSNTTVNSTIVITGTPPLDLRSPSTRPSRSETSPLHLSADRLPLAHIRLLQDPLSQRPRPTAHLQVLQEFSGL